MSLTDYRIQVRRIPVMALFSVGAVLLALVFLGLELRDYATGVDSLGADVKMGGVQVGGLDESQRLTRLERVYVEQPIFLRYNGNPIWLYPEDINFQLDVAGMEANVALEGTADDNYWLGFWNYLRREPQPPIEVDLQATYSEQELNKFLQEISNRYDTSVTGPSFDLASMRFFNGMGNTQLDKETARVLIQDALLSSDPDARSIDLPTTNFQGESVSMNTLRDGINAYLSSEGIFNDGGNITVSIYVQDLKTGEEMGILPNVQHSALSTIKVGILISYFRHQITAPSADEKFLLAAATICSINSSANELMNATTDYSGLYAQGVEYTKQTMCQAGATNTAILSSLDNGTREQLRDGGYNPDLYYQKAPDTPCPTGNIGSDLDTSVQPQFDSLNRTTATDMGILLMEIYDCAMTGSGLHTIFPEEITQLECQQIMEILNGTRFEHLAELGIPQATSLHNMYHKVGYGMTLNEAGTSILGGTGVVADVAIISSPATDYIFTIYISEKDTDNDGQANVARWFNVADISRIVWNYFNPNEFMPITRDPIRGNTGEGCVLPFSGEEISLTDIDQNRFDENDVPLPTACYDYPPPCGTYSR